MVSCLRAKQLAEGKKRPSTPALEAGFRPHPSGHHEPLFAMIIGNGFPWPIRPSAKAASRTPPLGRAVIGGLDFRDLLRNFIFCAVRFF